jgi:hypothetical protein
MNYSIDRVLDSYLKKALLSGINEVSGEDGYYMTITFKDRSVLTAWNTNKYYAWLARGEFKHENTKYCWDFARPSKSTMAELYKALKNHTY